MANERQHHDTDDAGLHPANRLGLDYRATTPRKVDCRIVDVHTHVYDTSTTPLFLAAADLYGIDKIVTMTPLDQIDALRARLGDRLDFIAIPSWRHMSSADSFQRQWLADLESFREKGARRMKFWVAPPLRGNHGLTLQDPFFQPLIDKGLELDFDFMIHVGDPSMWFQPGGRYANASVFGTKHEQYAQLEFLMERVRPRNVIAAHMGGNVEEPDFLQHLLDRYPNLSLDSSATKWIVREVARQPERVRRFVIENADRILFGSDLVVAEKFDFDHYASRYWAHQIMWETDYRGESPIEDPDGEHPPKLAGLDLPPAVLHKLYHENAERLGY